MIDPDEDLSKLSPAKLKALQWEVHIGGGIVLQMALPSTPACPHTPAARRVPWVPSDSAEDPKLLRCIRQKDKRGEASGSSQVVNVSLFQIADCCQRKELRGASYACIRALMPPWHLNKMHVAYCLNDLWHQNVRKALVANPSSAPVGVLQAEVDLLHQRAQLPLQLDESTRAALSRLINHPMWREMFTAVSTILDSIIRERAHDSLISKYEELDMRVDGRLGDASTAEARAQRSSTQGIWVLLILQKPDGGCFEFVVRQNFAENLLSL